MPASVVSALVFLGAAGLVLERMRPRPVPPLRVARRGDTEAAPPAPRPEVEPSRTRAIAPSVPNFAPARFLPTARTRSSPPDLLEAPASGRLDKPILVSFDAGSSDRGAAGILDALKERSIRTTVFLTGKFILRYPEIARRVAADGHEVGNHTFDHPHLTEFVPGSGQRVREGVTEEFLRDELLRTAEVFEKTTGRAMAPIWRAPFGEENPEIRAWAARAGFAHVSWTHGSGVNLDSLDWVADETSPRYRSSRRVIDRLLAAARPGGIILLHLGSERRDDPVGAQVPRLLDGLAASGYRFARATEFLGSP